MEDFNGIGWECKYGRWNLKGDLLIGQKQRITDKMQKYCLLPLTTSEQFLKNNLQIHLQQFVFFTFIAQSYEAGSVNNIWFDIKNVFQKIIYNY